MVSAKCAKRKYSYLLPTTPVLRLEGSRTLLEFLHRIHFHVDFQPHLRILSTSYMSHFHGRWAGILPGRQDSRATDNQTIHSIPYLIRPDNEDQLLPLFITTLHVLSGRAASQSDSYNICCQMV